MPKYRFVVVTSAGSRVEAESEAESVEKLRARLAGRGCAVEKVECLDDSVASASLAAPAPAETPAAGTSQSPLAERPVRSIHAALGRRGIVLASVLLLVAAGGLVWMLYGSVILGPLQKSAPLVKARNPETLTVDQALARHAEVPFAGKAADAPYSLHLSPGWKSNVDPDGSCTFRFSNGSDVVFGVSILRKAQDDPQPDVGAARTAFESLVYGKKPEGEDDWVWLQRQQAERPISQAPAVTRDGRLWTRFDAVDQANQRTWRAEFTLGRGCGYLVFGQSPVSDADGRQRAVMDNAFHDFALPAPSAEENRTWAEARQTAYREALREPKAVLSKGAGPEFTVALGHGWRELPLDGAGRLYLMGNSAALSFDVQTSPPFTAIGDARQSFRARIGCKDQPDWPITETTVIKADGKPWREWRAETEDHGVHTRWRGQWCGDLEHSYLLISRSWDQAPELDALASQLLDQAFSNFGRAPLRTSEYRGGVRPYVFALPGVWKPIDLSANGFDMAWEGPEDLVLRVETGAGKFTPAHLPALVAAARENFAKTYRLGPIADAGRWVRFRADIDIGDKSYACFFSLTVTPDAYYMVSVVVPTANLERCEPVVADIQDAIKLP